MNNNKNHHKKCRICKDENKSTNKNTYIARIHENHPKICEACIEKIICCEFYKHALSNINSYDFLELNNIKKQFNDDELYDYCMILLEKYNIIQYSGALLGSFNINKNSKILKKYEKHANGNLLNEIKTSENTNQYPLKYKMNHILNSLKNWESEIVACKSVSVDVLEISHWIRKGKLLDEPYYSFRKKYENLPDYADTYFKNSDLNARKKFLKNISKGNDAEESANNCGIKPSKIQNWIEKGKKNIKPYDEFYKNYKETEKKFHEIKEHNENKIKKDILNIMSEGFEIIEAIELLDNGKHSKMIKKWYKLGKMGNEKHSSFYKSCLEAQNEHEEKIKQLIELLSTGETLNETCEMLNINLNALNEETLNEIYEIQTKHQNIFLPLPKEYEESFKPAKSNKTGIAWVNKIGNQWTYSRKVNNKQIKFTDENIFKLYEKVIRNNQIWGIRDYDKANAILNKETLMKPNIEMIYGQGILSKLPQEIKNEFDFSTNKTGFAWVTKIRNQWNYKKETNYKTVEYNDENIYRLYEKVLSKNNIWGVINMEMAKKSIDESNVENAGQNNENSPKQKDNRTKREIMNIILKERKKGKTREECAKIANIPLRKIPHWSHEGRQQNGKDNIYFYKELKSIEDQLKKQDRLDIQEYNKKKNIEKRKKFLDHYKNLKNMHESAKLSSIKVSLIEKWISKGKQNQSPFKEFYDEFENINAPSTDLKNLNKILAPLPQEFEELFNTANKTGIAWVNKIGNLWVYSRTIKKKEVRITADNIFELYEKVTDNNQIWGIRDYDKLKNYIDLPDNFEIPQRQQYEISSKGISIICTKLNKTEININLKGCIDKKELFDTLNKIKTFEKDIIKIDINSIK